MHVPDMYVAGTVLRMNSTPDATGHFTPQTETSPSRVNSVKPRTGREPYETRPRDDPDVVQLYAKQLYTPRGGPYPVRLPKRSPRKII